MTETNPATSERIRELVDGVHHPDSRVFARLVKRTRTEDLRELMSGGHRHAVLEELFVRMPHVFRADRAGSLQAVVHWRIGDRPDGGSDTYQLVIDGGRCVVSAQPDREPALVLTIGAVDFLAVVTGNAHPVVLAMRGKLRSKGDLGLTAKFPTLFDNPKP